MFTAVSTFVPNFAWLEAPSLGGTPGPDLTRYFLVCGGLILGVVALGIGFRKLIARTLKARAAQRSMQIIDVLPLGGKQKLAVVRCYDRTFLLGLGEKELTSIAELDAVITPAKEPTPSRADLHAFSIALERQRQPKVPAASTEKEGLFA